MRSESIPVRIQKELYEAARTAGEAMSRSTAQQVAHWARIGRALEESGSVSVARIEDVLAGSSRYDELNERDQAAVRSSWDEGIERMRKGLDLAEKLSAEGRPWAELDGNGDVVVRRRRAEVSSSETTGE